MALLRVPGASWWSTPSPRIAARWKKGLKVAWTGAGKTQLLVPPVRAEGTDLKAFVQTEYGPALRTNDSVSGAGLLLPGGPKLTTSDNITIFALTKEYGTVTLPSFGYMQRDATNGATIGLAFNRSNTGSLSAGEVALWIVSTAVGNRGMRLNDVLPTTGERRWNSIAISHLTGSSYRNSVNGMNWVSQGGVVSSSTPTGTNYTTNQIPYIGGRSNAVEGVREPLALVFAWERALSQAELDEITRDPSVLFEEDVLWVPASAGGGDLVGVNSTQANTSSTAAITQTHVVVGVNSTQANTSSTASITQTHAVAGVSSTQTNTSSIAAITQTHVVVGVNSTQANTSNTAAITQTHVVIGVSSAQANTSNTGSIGAAITLTGVNSTQANTSSTAAITQTNVVVGINSTQANTSSTGAISSAGELTGTNSIQDNASSVSSITQIHVFTSDNSSQNNISGTGNIGSTVDLFGTSSTQGNLSNTSNIVQVHVLSGSNVAQSNIVSLGSINQVYILTGYSCVQANTSSSDGVNQVQILSGADSTQINLSATPALLSDILVLISTPIQSANNDKYITEDINHNYVEEEFNYIFVTERR